MADIEDESDFGSHFLDSMLEVEMTEDDNEIDVSKNCDPLETLPPVPTFDLQSETLSYKDVYKNSIPQPVLATLPLPDASKVPAVLSPSSVLVYPGELPAQKSVNLRATVPKISPKPSAKSLLKTPVKNTQPEETINDSKFLQEVFRPEFVQNVFVKADTHSDIAIVSPEEMKYYKTCFKDVSKVQNCRLHCTICDRHLGCGMSVEKKINVHSMLRVLTCKPCYEFYGDGNFPCDKGDNCEIYCRWCGQGGALVCCSFCPRVFCKKCVKRNYGPSFLKSIEKASDWACFCCAQKPLWPHRAICRALLEYCAQRKTDPRTSPKDTSSCCKGTGIVRKRLRSTSDKSDFVAISSPKTLPAKTKPSPPNKQLKTHFLFNSPPIKPKTPDAPKTPNIRPSKPATGPNIFSPRSILTGNTIIRGVATTNTPKFIASLPSSKLLQTPVLHGETLITPPPRLLLQAKTRPPVPVPPNSSYVRVSLTHQTPNVDINKIPTVKIPHDVQGLVLRLVFPDNRMQYVRLTSDGSTCKAGKEFPMPEFPKRGACFVEENLAEAFKACKTMHEKLSQILEKVNSRTKFTEESVLNSSVKKLHLAYEKAVDLYRELDKSLSEKQAGWKKGAGAVDVIDISDDEATAAAKKAKVERAERASRYSTLREKCRTLNDDSDIEILEDVAVNGKTPAKTNFKEKYRSRSGSETGDKETPKKRKKGRPRKCSKRSRLSRMQNGRPEESVEETADEKMEVIANGKLEEKADGKMEEMADGKTEEMVDGKMEEMVDGKTEEMADGKMEEMVDGKMGEMVDEKMEDTMDGNMEEMVDEKTEDTMDGNMEEMVDEKSEDSANGRMDFEPEAEKEPKEVTQWGDEGAREEDVALETESVQQET